MSTAGEWQPDDSFHDLVDGEYRGVTRVRDALRELGLDELNDRIVTSRDEGMESLREQLRRPDMPDGFEKWQLPITPGSRGRRPAFLFLTLCRPGATVPEHAHKNDAVFRIVMTGSIRHGDVELTSGDWIYIPRNCPYSYTAGPYGALLFHEYPGDSIDHEGP